MYDLSKLGPRRFLCVAESGWGKTTLAGSHPGLKLFLDCSVQVRLTFAKSRFGKDIWFEELADKLPVQGSTAVPEAWGRMQEILGQISQGKAPTLRMGGKSVVMPRLPDLVVIDDLSSWQDAVMLDKIHTSAKGGLFKPIHLEHYNYALVDMMRVLSTSKSWGCSLWLNAHEKLETDELKHFLKWVVVVIGPQTDAKLGGMFSEVWRGRYEMDPKTQERGRFLQLSGDEMGFAKTKLRGLPKFFRVYENALTAPALPGVAEELCGAPVVEVMLKLHDKEEARVDEAQRRFEEAQVDEAQRGKGGEK